MRVTGVSRWLRWPGLVMGPGLVMAALLAMSGVASASRPPNTAVGGGYAAIKVGQAYVQGKRALLPVSCSGTRGAACFVLITMSVRETLNGKVIPISHTRRQRHIKLVGVGGITETCFVDHRDTVPLPLYANGKRLLARHHPLPVLITVQDSHFKTIARTTVTFGT